jgi:hypothetical protein
VDPVTLILAALAAGAAAGLGDTATQAVKDGYAALKGLIKKRFAGSPKAEETLAEHEADPDTWEKPLAKQLEATGADQDPEIRRVAEQVVEAAEAAGIKTKYHVEVAGDVGIVGDQGHIDRMK